MKYLESLTTGERKEVVDAFKRGYRDIKVTGPLKLYRFAGYKQNGDLCHAHGSWWFSEKVFRDIYEKSKVLKVPFREFAKAKMALPDAWNDKLHLFELNIPGSTSLEALVGSVNYQPVPRSLEPEHKNLPENVLLIGGYEQYYFDYNEIKQFQLQQVMIFDPFG